MNIYLPQMQRNEVREIGERFGLSDVAVTQASRRMKIASESDATLQKQLDQVGK